MATRPRACLTRRQAVALGLPKQTDEREVEPVVLKSSIIL